MLLSNVYLHYVLDLWFERVVKVRLRGEAHLVRYIDDFVICFQYRSDAIRVQDALRLRLGKFGLTLEAAEQSFRLLTDQSVCHNLKMGYFGEAADGLNNFSPLT